MKKNFTYNFVDELEYDAHGDKAIAESIEVKAPSNKIMPFVTTIECLYRKTSFDSMARLQSMLSAEKLQKIMELQESSEINKEEVETPSDEIVNSMMSCCEASDMVKVYNAFDMILKDSATLDDGVKFGGTLFAKMSPFDTKCILGEYIKSFFISSPRV